MASEVMEHRWLLFALFRLSQSKMSIQPMIEKADLTQWCLRFLDTVPVKPHFMTRLAIENVTGIL